MDWLYRAYASPMDLMTRYINQGRFGNFVKGFLQSEFERRKEEAEKDSELKLWIAYVHSYADETFDDWKKRVCTPASTTTGRKKDDQMTTGDAEKIIQDLFPG